ncbi:MAG: competence/damage-inducible protein A [Actinomycetota bacterium]|nr:competence/damage-inducible protein A [Actinomycetota bacterium]
MRAELVGVGTELLLGQIANTNARWMSQELAAIGIDVLHHQVVGDNLDRIVEALTLGIERADVVLVTGGLGPTEDDITRDALAAMLGVPMRRHREIEQLLRSKFDRFGRGGMPKSNLRQADVPESCRYIVPIQGTAPGLIAEFANGGRIYSMPGVPAEMVEMMRNTVLPELAGLAGPAVLVSRTVRCAGIGESRVAEILRDLFTTVTNPTIAYLASLGEVKVRLTAKASTEEEAEGIIAPIADEVVRRLGDSVFTTRDESLEGAVARLLREQALRFACAESLTGGGVAERMSRVPGSSRTFVGAAVTYTAEAKQRVLGVTRETLEGPGVVSEACAREMATGVRRLFGVDVAVSLTGAAGPQPHDGAEPGTVWIGLDTAEVHHALGYVSKGEREQVRRWAEQAALDLVRRYLEGRELPVSERLA